METIVILMLVLEGLLGISAGDTDYKQYLDNQVVIDHGIHKENDGLYNYDQLKLLYIEAQEQANTKPGGGIDLVGAN